MKILVTGTAGFIGFHLVNKLIKEGHKVVGLDQINNYYDVNLKYARLKEAGIEKKQIEYNKIVESKKYKNYSFIKLDLEDKENLLKLFKKEKFNRVCNLAAQAGVRYAFDHPDVYIQRNIVSFLNILESCRYNKIEHLAYASSSSVYGLNNSMPSSTKGCVDHPISLYAATKKANELMAHSYSHLYGLPTTGLRFFNVYGPWGRPDSALFIFTKAILKGEKIKVFNYGKNKKDFTYVEDIVKGVYKIIKRVPKSNLKWSGKNPDPASSLAPYKVYNIGHGEPVGLFRYIEAIEKGLGKKSKQELLPIQPGDVPISCADVSDLKKDFNYNPDTSVEKGVDKFVKWYKEYYKV